MREEMVRTHILIPKDLLKDIDEEAGKRRRSEFIVDELREVIRRRKLARCLDEARGSLTGHNIPEWETPESTEEWIRKGREEWDDRVKELWGED